MQDKPSWPPREAYLHQLELPLPPPRPAARPRLFADVCPRHGCPHLDKESVEACRREPREQP